MDKNDIWVTIPFRGLIVIFQTINKFRFVDGNFGCNEEGVSGS